MAEPKKLFDVAFGAIYEEKCEDSNDYTIFYVLSCGGGIANKELKSVLEEIEPISKTHPTIKGWVTKC